MATRARTKPAEDTETNSGPIEDALLTEKEGLAEDLTNLFTELSGTTSGNIEVLLYLVPSASSGWQFVKKLELPIDFPSLAEELKAEFGGGVFKLRVRVVGKIKTTRGFELAKSKSTAVTIQGKDNNNDMLQLILAQNASSKSDMMAMFQMMQSQQQQSTNTVMALVTAIIAKPSDNPLSMLPSLLEAMKPKENGGMKEAIETLAAAKGLFGDGGGGGGDPDSLIGLAGKFLPGLLTGAAELAKTMPKQEPQQQVLRTVQPQHPQIVQRSQTDISQLTGADKVLAVLAPDVLFSMQRGHSPEVAADLVLESMDKNGITEDEVSSLIVQFTSLGDQWPQYLLERGIDVSQHLQWFSQFVGALVAGYQDDNSEGGGGSAGDAENHGEAGERGESVSEGETASA